MIYCFKKRYCIYMFEKGRELLTPPVETTTIIFDMRDFSLENMDYGFVSFMADLFLNKYPESLGWAIVYCAPWIFNACWRLIKIWMDPKTAEKIKFLDKSEQLLDFVDKDQLLKEYGGTDTWIYSAP